MDESVSNKLRGLEARCTILKHEITVQRNKLDRQKKKMLSETQFYRDIERNLKALYDEEEKTADELTRFKLRHSLD